MSNDLKPCPFCGKPVELRKAELYGGERTPSTVRCRPCNYWIANMGVGSDDEVVERWNRRFVEDAHQAEIARLTAERDNLRLECHAKDSLIDDMSGAYHALHAELTALRERERWIPVGERLPPGRERVMFYERYNGHMTGYHNTTIPQWTALQGLYWHGDTYSWITHWRPLPQPPQEVGE